MQVSRQNQEGDKKTMSQDACLEAPALIVAVCELNLNRVPRVYDISTVSAIETACCVDRTLIARRPLYRQTDCMPISSRLREYPALRFCVSNSVTSGCTGRPRAHCTNTCRAVYHRTTTQPLHGGTDNAAVFIDIRPELPV